MLTEDFVHSLHRRGIDVTALRIEPGMPKAYRQWLRLSAMQPFFTWNIFNYMSAVMCQP